MANSSRALVQGFSSPLLLAWLLVSPRIGAQGTVSAHARLLPGSTHAARPGAEPDWVVFVDRTDPLARPVLHRAAVDGSRPTVVLARHDSGDGAVGGVISSPDRRWIVYLGDDDLPQVFHSSLFSVPLDGSAEPVQLSLQGQIPAAYSISPDSRWVVYKPIGPAIFAVPIEGGVPPLQLNDPPPRPFPAAFAQSISPDSRRVVFLSDLHANNANEVFSVPIDRSSPPVQLTPGFSEGRTANSFLVTPDARSVVYRADQREDDVFELFVAPIEGGAPSRRVNGPLVAGGDVPSRSFPEHTYLLSPDGRWVVYLADQDQDEVFELYRAPLSGRGPVLKLNAPLPPNGDVLADFRISPDSRRVVYRADQEEARRIELYSAPLDGSGPPVRLNAPLVQLGDVGGDLAAPLPFAFDVSSEGSRVVYLADQERNDVYELFSVLIDGAAAPVRLNGPLVAEGGATRRVEYLPDFQISPDGSLVAYWADEEADDRFELFVAPIKGNQPSRKLSGEMIPGGDVGAWIIGHAAPLIGKPLFQFTGNAERIVYLADQEVDQAFEVFGVPTDGAMEPLRLHEPLMPEGGAHEFLVVGGL